MWLLAEIKLPDFLFFAGVSLACAILLMRSLKKLRQPARKAPTPARRDEPHKQSLEFNRWEVRMHETARELIARIDTKLVLLERLIRDADDRIARLESIQDRIVQMETRHDELAFAPSERSPPGSQFSFPETIREATEAKCPSPPPKASPASRRAEDIYALADAGRSSIEIANQLQTPVGEIELILGLRSQR